MLRVGFSSVIGFSCNNGVAEEGEGAAIPLECRAGFSESWRLCKSLGPLELGPPVSEGGCLNQVAQSKHCQLAIRG
jgi:hypothetical protein